MASECGTKSTAETLDRYVGKFALAATEFFLRVVDERLTFRFGADGQAAGITLHQGGRDMPAERVP